MPSKDSGYTLFNKSSCNNGVTISFGDVTWSVLVHYNNYSSENIERRNNFMNELKVNGIYNHFKGDYYLVVDVANHSEAKEKYGVYRRLYGDGSLWIRPIEMF